MSEFYQLSLPMTCSQTSSYNCYLNNSAYLYHPFIALLVSSTKMWFSQSKEWTRQSRPKSYLQLITRFVQRSVITKADKMKEWRIKNNKSYRRFNKGSAMEYQLRNFAACARSERQKYMDNKSKIGSTTITPKNINNLLKTTISLCYIPWAFM